MRVKIIRWTDPTSSLVNLRVLRWCDGQWEPVGPPGEFPLNESERANEFAMKLSLTKRVPVELAMFEDGEKLEGRIGPLVTVPDCENGEKISGEPGTSPAVQYKPLSVPSDCCVVSIEEALYQIGEEAKHVSSDVHVSDRWTPAAISELKSALRDSLANRVSVDRRLKPSEWYVECCGTRVGSNPPW
jgi:hypothetical protein